MNYLHVLVAPEPGRRGRPDFFVQMSRTLSLRGHRDAALREQMLETMKREFTPSITEPLNANALLDLCEQNAVPKGPQAYALAAFNAYMGRDDRARYWCSRFDELVNDFVRDLGIEWEEVDRERRAFLDSLEKWLEAGEARYHLDRVLEESRHKWGLV